MMRTTIEMAREAAGDDWKLFQEYMPEIHRLTELVRADERAQRKPLTDDEIAKEVEAELTHYWNGEYIDTTGARDQLTAFARAIEAKLKEKNT